MGETKNIEPIIDWIADLEDKAARCYEKAAVIFSGEKELAKFLDHLVEDERYHSKIVRDANVCLRDKKADPALILSFDSIIMQQFEFPFVEFEKDLDKKRFTKKDLFGYIAIIEFMEWNDIFLYIIDNFKECGECYDFSHTGPLLQRHRRDIERFVESDPELSGFLEMVKGLPQVGKDKLLLVDDSEPILAMFSSILKKEGIVECATDGKEALDKLSREDFSLVMAEGDMQVMGGIEFYKRATEKNPRLKERILFYTADKDSENLAFFKDNNLRYLLMPLSINELRNAVVDILDRPVA
jgi:CheY-like chemotaxis protein